MLSIVINVKNGAEYLERTLNALSRFNDVVLLDNYSTDNTIAIAKQFTNVRIFEHEFCGMGKVRNLAASYAKNDWVFFVDCDEIVSPQLTEVLLTTQFETGNIYRILRKNYYDGFLIDSSSWGDDWILRLYNKTETKFEENEVHDSFVPNHLKHTKLEGGFLYHFPYNNVNKLIDKMQFYSTLYAKQHFKKKKCNLVLLPFRAFIMFVKCYILKRGFMQGYEGLAISSYNAMGVFSKYIKLYELSYKRSIGLAIYIKNIHSNLLPTIDYINQQTLLPQKVFFIVDDSRHLDNANFAQLIKHNLIVPAKIITSGSDMYGAIKNELAPELENIVYLKQIGILSNHNYFKQCKKAILKGKSILHSEIFTL
jgi:glycosyltransferase involved in cell wall biosynthesis